MLSATEIAASLVRINHSSEEPKCGDVAEHLTPDEPQYFVQTAAVASGYSAGPATIDFSRKRKRNKANNQCSKYRKLSFLKTTRSEDKETRQLSYRKEDRAMRPIYGCTEKF